MFSNYHLTTVSAPKTVKLYLRERPFSLTVMDDYISTENCPGDSRSVEGRRETTKTSRWLSKVKISRKINAPDTAEPTGLQWANKVIKQAGQTCRERLQSLEIPSCWRSGLQIARSRHSYSVSSKQASMEMSTVSDRFIATTNEDKWFSVCCAPGY